ncbi:uncharacterized protein LOC106391171 isoform X4 [Brassica napus]|uniref:uncharacterized protein LOC106391171 isoform X4 n=1 Tax=Brassica napus TaxID=3708 RepID=UPI00207AB021|nr:uncharacterized protein LOC106391171 isoform X4 [Brassica napus]
MWSSQRFLTPNRPQTLTDIHGEHQIPANHIYVSLDLLCFIYISDPDGLFVHKEMRIEELPNIMDLMGVSSKIQEKIGSSKDFPDDLHEDDCMSLRLLKLTWETSPKWMECLFLSNAIIKLIMMRTLSCPRTNRADWSSTCSSSC